MVIFGVLDDLTIAARLILQMPLPMDSAKLIFIRSLYIVLAYQKRLKLNPYVWVKKMSATLPVGKDGGDFPAPSLSLLSLNRA